MSKDNKGFAREEIQGSSLEIGTRINGLRLEQMYRKIERLERFVTGGDKPEQGLIVKVDRLEQFANQVRWFLGVISVSATGLFLIEVFKALSIGH